MKRFSILVGLAAAAIIFTGCGGGGGGGGGYVPPPDPGPGPVQEVLYLDDGAGGLVGIPYFCTSGISDITGPDGDFYFYPGDDCTFDLTGFGGTIYLWDPLYIDYADETGVSGIEYDCWSGTGGWTDIDGYFDYDTDDECTFYL